MAEAFAKGRALVVGVANYLHVQKLPLSVLDDARDVADLLRAADLCGYPPSNVELLLDADATLDGIRKAFTRLTQTSAEDETVVFYFSGHGARAEIGPDAGIYLIPFDCEAKRLKDTAIGADELTSLLAGIKAERLVVLLDACHAGGAGEVKALDPAAELKAGLDEKTYSMLSQGTGRVIVASSRTTEVSRVLPGMRNSLFTHYLLESLRGKAHTRGDGLVRVFDVFHYVSDKVPARACQHPIFKAHDLENNFPLALDRGGKQLAPSGDVGLMPRPPRLSGKARMEIRKGLVSRWVDLADYFDLSLEDRDACRRAEFPAGKLLDWLEERHKLPALRDAFSYLGWDDLIKELDRHPR